MRPPIVLQLDDAGADSGYLQSIAGEPVWSSRPLGYGARRETRPILSSPPPPTAWSPIYDGPGLVEGRLQRIGSWSSPEGWRRVDFEDGETYLVAPDGGSIRRSRRGSAPPVQGPEFTERVLGAPLALAFAPRGIYLLHASAVALRRAAIAISAPSGAGKSTLAAAAARRGFAHVADDQLAVRLGRTPAVLTGFPQLKMPIPDAEAPGLPAELRFCALVEIEHTQSTPTVSMSRVRGAEAVLALTRATVASRLFDPRLLAAHFEACAEAGSSVEVVRLRYPSGLDRVHEALETLADLAR